jgi:hypothetical protein
MGEKSQSQYRQGISPFFERAAGDADSVAGLELLPDLVAGNCGVGLPAVLYSEEGSAVG